MSTVLKIALDASGYRNELNKVVSDTQTAKSQLASKSQVSGGGQTTITPKVDLKPAAEKFSKVGSMLSAFGSQIGGVFGAAGQAIGALAAGPLAIAAAAVGTLITLLSRLRESFINAFREAGEMAGRNAESIREAADATRQASEKADQYLNSLKSLAQTESLSNAQKAEAKKLIDQLAQSYGNLGIKLDETTGKLTGVDRAMIKKAEKDKKNRVSSINAEIKELQNDNAQQDNIVDAFWSSKEEVAAAAARKQSNTKRIMDLQRQLREAKNSDAAGDLRKQYKAETEDAAKQNRQQKKSFEERKQDDAFNAEKDIDKKIANRQNLIDQHKKEKIDPLEKKVQAAETAVKNATGDDKIEAERNLLSLQKELQTEREKAYNWEKQISDLQKQQAEAVKKLTEQASYETEYNRLILAGQHDKAAALKLEYDLKQQNLKLTQSEKQALLDQQKIQKSLSLHGTLKDQARNLQYKAMEAAGQGKEAAKLKALDDAEKAKGSALTDNEKSAVNKITELTQKLNDISSNNNRDTVGNKILTNDLTRRGGFQGGAVMPSSENVTKSINNKMSAVKDILDEIKRIQNDLQSTITQGLKT